MTRNLPGQHRAYSYPNRADDEQYIVRLIGQVIRVSVEAVKIVKSLPAEFAPPHA